jgi:hypothetical protein
MTCGLAARTAAGGAGGGGGGGPPRARGGGGWVNAGVAAVEVAAEEARRGGEIGPVRVERHLLELLGVFERVLGAQDELAKLLDEPGKVALLREVLPMLLLLGIGEHVAHEPEVLGPRQQRGLGTCERRAHAVRGRARERAAGIARRRRGRKKRGRVERRRRPERRGREA